MKNSKHIIFCDIDGTIYDESLVIDEQAISQVRIAQSKGIKFIIATGNGRFPNGQISKVGKVLQADLTICSNGAGVWDPQKETFIYQNTIPVSEIKYLVKLAEEIQVGFQFWDEDVVWNNSFITEDNKKSTLRIMGAAGFSISEKSYQKPIFKSEFYDPDSKKIDWIENKLQKQHFEYAKMSSNHIEVTGKNVSKGNAVKWVAKLLNVSLENCMAIGDSANDLSMLKIVNYSYVMANATDKIVINTANYHTSDVNQHGLARAIEDFLYRVKN